MKDVRLLDCRVNQADAHRIANISPKNGSDGVAEHPRTVVLLLVQHRSLKNMPRAKEPPQRPLTIDHRFRPVRDGHDRYVVVPATTPTVGGVPVAVMVGQ